MALLHTFVITLLSLTHTVFSTPSKILSATAADTCRQAVRGPVKQWDIRVDRPDLRERECHQAIKEFHDQIEHACEDTDLALECGRYTPISISGTFDSTLYCSSISIEKAMYHTFGVVALPCLTSEGEAEGSPDSNTSTLTNAVSDEVSSVTSDGIVKNIKTPTNDIEATKTPLFTCTYNRDSNIYNIESTQHHPDSTTKPRKTCPKVLKALKANLNAKGCNTKHYNLHCAKHEKLSVSGTFRLSKHCTPSDIEKALKEATGQDGVCVASSDL